MMRNRVGLETCLDFEKLRPLLSVADLAAFLRLQDYARNIVGGGVETGCYDLWSAWLESCTTEESKQYLQGPVDALARDATTAQEVTSRLFDVDAKQARFKEPFITYDITPGFGGIVIYPGFFTSNAGNDLHIRAVEAILKLLYVYTHTYNEASQTLWYRRYLELLSSKQIVAA